MILTKDARDLRGQGGHLVEWKDLVDVILKIERDRQARADREEWILPPTDEEWDRVVKSAQALYGQHVDEWIARAERALP